MIEIRYDVLRQEKARYAGTPAEARRWLSPDRLVPDTPMFHIIASDAIGSGPRRDDLTRARALYDHVLSKLRYDKTGDGWGHGDAVYACQACAGNCTDFHSYFIALARAAGIPARFAIGATIPADKDEGGLTGYHCWAECFDRGHWVPVDLSEAWKNPALADYYFGHNPANRFELSTGRDLVVDPAPASGPINFLVYPVLEVGGKPAAVRTDFSFRRIKDS